MPRILLVDDDIQVTRSLENALWSLRQEWDMEFCNDGPSALEVIESEPIDLIVSDMRMPGMDGPELFLRIKERWPDVVRVVLSAHAEFEATLNALPMAHQFLSKPADAAALEDAIRCGLRIRGLLTDPKLQAVIEKLGPLPSAPSVFQRLQERLRDPACGMNEVTHILEQDPALVGGILRTVNSAAFGLRNSIRNIQQAVAYLGVNMVRNLVVTTTTCDGHEIPDDERRHASLTAHLAREVAAGNKYLAETAYLAGVLHDLGKPLVSRLYTDRCFLPGQWRDELETVGTTHAEIGAFLIGTWGLSYDIIEGVGLHHRPELAGKRLTVAAAVAAADALAHESMGDCSAWDLVDAGFFGVVLGERRWQELQERGRVLADQIVEP